MYKNYSTQFDNTSSRGTLPLGSCKKAWNAAARGLERATNAPAEWLSLAGKLSSPYGPVSLADLLSVSFPQFNNSALPSRALIMAAGEGTRLRPLTEKKPKPLVEVDEKPLIEYTLDLMGAAGVQTHLINVGYMAEQIESYATKIQASSFPQKEYLTVRQDDLKTSPRFWRLVSTSPFFYANADSLLLPASRGTEINPFIRLSQERARAQSDITLLICPRGKAIGHEGNGDYNMKEGRLVWGDPDKDDLQYVWTGVALVAPRFARSLIQTWVSSQIQGTASGNVQSKDAHGLLGRMADPHTGVLRGFSAVIHEGLFFDVSTPHIRDQAEAAVRQLTPAPIPA